MSNNSPSQSGINIIKLEYAPSIASLISTNPSVSFSPSIPIDVGPAVNLPLTNYDDTVDDSSIILNDLSEADFDFKNGVNFQNSESKYIIIPQLTGSYTISFDIFVTSYNSITSNYIFNHGVLYNKGIGYLGTGLGLTMHLTSPTNLAVNMYQTSIGAGKVHNIPVSNFINTWNKIVLVVKPIVKGNEYILYVNGVPNNFNSSYVNTILSMVQSASFILGGQTGNGNAFNGYMKNFKAFNYALSMTQVKGLSNYEDFDDFLSFEIRNINYIRYIELISIVGVIYYVIIILTNSNKHLINNKMFNIVVLICSFISLFNLIF
jgi:hypothetical protein